MPKRKPKQRAVPERFLKRDQPPAGNAPAQPAAGEPLVFQRSLWKHLFRMVIVLILVTLNVSLVGSTIESHRAGHPMNPATEILSYVLVALMNAMILVPSLFEVHRVEVGAERLKLKALLWSADLDWSEVLWLKDPIFLAFAIVRTRRCFYLINKRDLKPFNELVDRIRLYAARGSA